MAHVLELGDVYFVFRPRVERDAPRGLEDVQRFYVVLAPRDKPIYRRLVIGRKRMPDIPSRERLWGYVDKVARCPEAIEEELESATYRTKTRGERHLPAARPAGAGVYAIVDHEGHTHFAYALELPEEPGEVQTELRLEPQASYIVAAANPERPLPGVGLRDDEKTRYPQGLQARFGPRRFAPLDPELLDYEGAELVLIGTHDDVRAELGIDLDRERETGEAADIFEKLHMDRDKHPARPLFEGVWD